MSEYTFEIWQDGSMVASVTSQKEEDARNHALHYALIYGQDGPVEIRGAGAGALFDAIDPRRMPKPSTPSLSERS